MWLLGLSLCVFYGSFVWVICFSGSFDTLRGIVSVSLDTIRDLASRYRPLLLRVLG